MINVKAIDILKLAICIVACLSAGLIGSIFTNRAVPTWYVTLEKPSFTPPNWLFAPVWTMLFILMGVSAFLVWRIGLDRQNVRVALIIFIIQLILNVLWSVAFFGFRSPGSGLIVIVALWIAILLTLLSFVKVSVVAGLLLVPYILWVTFASVLNASVYILNRG